MSVVGIDFGDFQSVIAVARNRGIDVIVNEVSKRSTPTLVGFDSKRRLLGEKAEDFVKRQPKNVIGTLKRLAGRRLDNTEIQTVESQFITGQLCDVDGQVGAKVMYQDKETHFAAVQLIAMYFGRLRDIAAHEIGAPVSDVVISVPGWFADAQRRAILDASKIAGLNCLRLMNDTTAAALGYGITKTDLPEDNPRKVVFVDLGHSSYSVAIVEFKKGRLAVKATAFDPHLGGRYFDELLVDHFCKEFEEKHGADVRSNPKLLQSLRSKCEKLKRVLSANTKAPLDMENVKEDKDVHTIIGREEFEELTKDLFERLKKPLQDALDAAKLTVDQVDAIELIGGSTRIPAVKEKLIEFFNKELSTTLNQDEAVARGCALQCAMLSPAFRVRDFSVQDTTPYPVKLVWPTSPDSNTLSEREVFESFNSIPSAKVVKFLSRNNLDVEIHYSRPDMLPSGTNSWIGRFSIKDTSGGSSSAIKVKTRVNLHGIVSADGAHAIVLQEDTSEPADTPEPAKDNMETDDKAGETSEAPVAEKPKKIEKRIQLPLAVYTSSLSEEHIARYTQSEGEMWSSDKLVSDTEEQKNALEAFVYSTRDNIGSDGIYSPYVQEADRTHLQSKLDTIEEWLYDDEENGGADATKSAYVQKQKELHELVDPIHLRYNEAENRPRLVASLRENIKRFLAAVEDKSTKYDHIADEEKKKVADRSLQVQQWLDTMVEQQAKLQPFENPILLTSEIKREHDSLSQFVKSIMDKPKPKPPAPATPPPAPEASGTAPASEGGPDATPNPAEGSKSTEAADPEVLEPAEPAEEAGSAGAPGSTEVSAEESKPSADIMEVD